MKKKHIAIIVAILVAVAMGFYFSQAPTPIINDTPQDTSAPQGKIDINAVCEGALAYMSFPDGASAELFVSECKEGKHPEVIEKFKADLNISNDAAI